MAQITQRLTMDLDLQNINNQYFKSKLQDWHRKMNVRTMPWKGEKNPYKIWLSEIILQQTRVEQGLKYYDNFICKYATLSDLAHANDDDVFKLWEGLGYYNRCRNMLFTARYIRDHYNGKFPRTYNEILSLKGIGPYTAAAISSFAYNLPHAVVDGNVVRVYSRFYGIDRQLISSADKKYYQAIADKHLYKKRADLHNQAIMDFGATVCTPKKPACTTCTFKRKCKAYLNNEVAHYPPKKKALKLKKRYLHYVIVQDQKNIWLRKRGVGDIWQQLYEPVLMEQRHKPSWLQNEKVIWQRTQKLSHQHLDIKFYFYDYNPACNHLLRSYKKTTLKSLPNKAFPKSIYEFFKKFEYI